jgi:dihydrofolate reductase
LVLYVASSLDGYIAKEDDSLDWLFKAEGQGDNGYSNFYETVDTILMGRRTYEQILVLENGKFPYKDKKCYVFSKTVNETNEHVEFVNDDILNFSNKLKRQIGKNIWIVGGGSLLNSFLKEKLVDEFIITIAPTIIGNGIPLFQKDDLEIELCLKGITRFSHFAQLTYELV